ncbi:MAG: diguanylate cyclase, partial [Pseudomonadota bacterium]
MIFAEAKPGLRLVFLGEMSVSARSLLRMLSALPDVEQVIEITDPETLPHHLAAHRPDIVLVDFGITEDAVHRYLPDEIMPLVGMAPVIALTSGEREQRGIRAVLHGAQRYVCIESTDADYLVQVLQQCRDEHAFIDTLSGRNDAFTAIIESLNDGVIVVNREGRLVTANPAARRLLGLDRDSMDRGQWLAAFCSLNATSGEPLDPQSTPIARARRGEQFADLALIHDADGDQMIFSVSGHGLRNQRQQLIGGLVSFRDITDDFNQNRSDSRRVMFDPMTDLPNRVLFEEQLQQAVARAERSQRTLGVMHVDLDRFKVVNESLGHDIGDLLLKETADRLKGLLRNGDLLCRFGGDEFAVGIENLTGPRDAAAAAQKIIRGLSETFRCGGNEIYISPSVGIALFPEAGESAAALLDAAKRATGLAKQSGGAKLQFHSTAQAPNDEQLAELEVGIRHALLRRELTLRYQPRVNLSNGRLMGLEALIRWQHPRFGLLPPARFLPLLESSGLIHSVGEWVINSVAAQLHAWQQRYEVP